MKKRLFLCLGTIGALVLSGVAMSTTRVLADLPSLYEQSKTWVNPDKMHETWQHGVKLTSQGGLWDLALVDGAGQANPSPWHAGSIEVINQKYLSLQVTHDPNFDSESDEWVPGNVAATRYNNAFLTGMGGWMPKPVVGNHKATEIVAEFKARWPLGIGSFGSSGAWFETWHTFDSQGNFIVPFQAAGLSWVGMNSEYLAGLKIEGVTGFYPDALAPVDGVNMTQWTKFRMSLRWNDENSMIYSLSVNDGPAQEITVVPIGPIELQLWKDNYKIVTDPVYGFAISYENIPQNVVDKFQVKDVKMMEKKLQ